MSKWIKKGDKVVVISGNDKGKVGEVLRRHEDRVVIQGVNIRKKHVKRRADKGPGDIIEMEVPIHVSNVSLCGAEGTPVKLKVRMKDGNKELFYLEGQKEVIHRQIKKNS